MNRPQKIKGGLGGLTPQKIFAKSCILTHLWGSIQSQNCIMKMIFFSQNSSLYKIFFHIQCNTNNYHKISTKFLRYKTGFTVHIYLTQNTCFYNYVTKRQTFNLRSVTYCTLNKLQVKKIHQIESMSYECYNSKMY